MIVAQFPDYETAPQGLLRIGRAGGVIYETLKA
jgi:hypothetical protein